MILFLTLMELHAAKSGSEEFHAYMFSPAGEATLWGATCSYSYLAIWLVATYVLRKRKGWIWSTFIVRLMTIVSFCLTMLLTKFNLDIKNMLWAIIAYIPYGLLVPVWDRQLLVPCYLFECNYKHGSKKKWIYYWAYPLHILFFAILRCYPFF